jgi:hypothetical protein
MPRVKQASKQKRKPPKAASVKVRVPPDLVFRW